MVMSKGSTASPTEAYEDVHETANAIQWYTVVVFGTIFILIGLLGNSLSIAVWNRKEMRSSTGRYLTAQSIASICFLIFFFLMDSLKAIDPQIKTSYAYAIFHSYIGYPLQNLALKCSIWFTVGVTVDRYIMVCLPKHAKKLCNEKRATVCIAIITGLCFIISAPHFAIFTPIWDTNATQEAFKYTEFGDGQGGKSYQFWVHCMALILVPWFTIATFNCLIIRRVFHAGKKIATKGSKKEQTKRPSEEQMTTLLLTITFVFKFLMALLCIVQCIYKLKPKTVDLVAVSEAYAIAKLAVVINASINFILYCFTSQRFRHELFVMFGGSCGPRYQDGFSSVFQRRPRCRVLRRRCHRQLKKSRQNVNNFILSV